MAKLAILGHATRGNEVIETLEMFGGNNQHAYVTDSDCFGFYIGDKTRTIYYDWRHNLDGRDFTIFTLEELLEKFPYKVGDKVIYKSEVFPIIGMKWSCSNNTVIYTMKSNYDTIDCYDSTWMKPYKEEAIDKASKAVFDASAQCCDISNKIIKKETMEKEISGSIVDRFICLEGYDFYDDKGNIIDTKEIIMKKKQPKHPKTYEECCKVLGHVIIDEVRGYKELLLDNLQMLLICRDAYWKIAGDWKPNWEDGSTTKHTISCVKNKIELRKAHEYTFTLAFPTEEMRDAFYENFKDLIEECKELL